MKRLAAGLMILATAGCAAVGPNYRTPRTAMPAAFGEQGRVAEAAAQTQDLSRWWTRLGDPELSSLITRALAQNLDVQAAVSRVRAARQQLIVAHSAGLPSVSGSAVAAQRNAPSMARANPAGAAGQAGGGSSAAQSLFTLPDDLQVYSLGADATWQIDIFGGVRRGVEAARAQVQAADWQVRDAQVMLSAEVARAYLTLRLAQAQTASANADITRLRDLLDLVGARAKAGVTTDLDVNQQRQALQARLAQLPQLDAQARTSTHAIAILLAQPPTAIDAELATAQPLPAAPLALPIGLPSDLLQRRPDIRVAERQYAAATAQIGVAEADLYPKLNLIGLASFAGMDLSSLLSRRNFSTIGVGQGSWSLFNGGRTRATIAARREAADQAELTYRQTILAALRDVEDALVNYAADRQHEATLSDDLKTAQDTTALSDQQYRAGTVAFINVLQAQQAVQTAQDQLLQARSARIGDLVALFSALGGGWTDTAA